MTTTLIRNNYRPFTFNATNVIEWFKSINYLYWLQRAPMALLSIPAAYGVSAFASVHLPEPFNWLAGAGFESVYLGCVALADQMYEEDDFTTFLWWGLNIIAVVMSALINVLFSSGNSFAGITPESLVHGIPLPALSFGYSLLLHKITNANIARDYKAQKEANEIRLKKEKYEADNPYVCEVCAERKPTRKALSNHMRAHKPKV